MIVTKNRRQRFKNLSPVKNILDITHTLKQISTSQNATPKVNTKWTIDPLKQSFKKPKDYQKQNKNILKKNIIIDSIHEE